MTMSEQPAEAPQSSPSVARVPGDPTVGAPRSRRLGAVAAAVGITVFVVSIIAAVFMGIAAAPYAVVGPSGFNVNLRAGTGDPIQDQLTVLALLHVVLGTALGVWAMAQGIVAIATKRGRGFGIVALIFAFLAPGLSLIAYLGVALAVYSAAQ
jgi:hypothetical protein